MNKTIILITIFCLIIINIAILIYGRIKVKSIDKNDSDKVYKESMKYMIISAITSFISIIVISILMILKAFK